MTMFETSGVVFKEGALENIEKYSGYETGDFFDKGFIEKEFSVGSFGRLPYEWLEVLGEPIQMDYGSWLYICDKKTLFKLLGWEYSEVEDLEEGDSQAGDNNHKATSPPPKDFPDRDYYGIFEVEIY